MAKDLETLNEWLEANLLVVNMDKPKFVLFHNKKYVAINWKLKIGTHEIERKSLNGYE